MNSYNEIYTALDFAQKYGAPRVLIELDEGKVTLPTLEAVELFDNDFGFSLLAIYFESEDGE